MKIQWKAFRGEGDEEAMGDEDECILNITQTYGPLKGKQEDGDSVRLKRKPKAVVTASHLKILKMVPSCAKMGRPFVEEKLPQLCSV